MPFDLETAIAVKESESEVPERSTPFDINSAKPVESDTFSKLMKGGKDVLKTAFPPTSLFATEEERLSAALTVATVVRWPFQRFIEHPLATVATGLQEGRPVGETAKRLAKTFMPGEIPEEEYGTYSKMWNNYYKSLTGAEAPGWYLGMASFGSAAVFEPLAMKGLKAGAEWALTRKATEEEAKIIKNAFQPLNDWLNRKGVTSDKLHPEGNIVRLDEKTELFLNGKVSMVLRGDKIRIPRWWSITGGKSVSIPEVSVDGKLVPINEGVLPLTGKEIVLSPELMTSPMAGGMPAKRANVSKLSPKEGGEIQGVGDIFRISEPTEVTNTKGEKVTLPKGEEYRVYNLEGGKVRLQDGKQITVYEGELDKLKGQVIKGEPEAGGMQHFEKKKEAMQERLMTVEEARDNLSEIEPIHKRFLRGIEKYKEGYLSEELKGIPKQYISTSGGLSPDEALEELRTQYGVDLRDESELKDYFQGLADRIQELDAIIESNKPKMVTMKETTVLKKQEQLVSQMQKKALSDMKKLAEEDAKVAERLAKQAFMEGKKVGAEVRKQRYFGPEITKEERGKLYYLAMQKGLIYTDFKGKKHDKLQGLLRFYRGASYDQFRNYISNLTGEENKPPKLFRMYGDIDKDAELINILKDESKDWVDINKVEINTLDPVRIVEKVTGKNLWDDNILADNTFNVLSTADEALFDRKANELDELEANREGIKSGSKESAELMRKFETKEPLSDKEKKVVDYLRRKYDDWISEANVMREQIGKSPIPYRQDYMTHIIEQNALHDFFKGNEGGMAGITDEQINAIRKGDYTKGNMPFNKFAQRRMGEKTKYDAIGNYLDYMDVILREIYYSPAVAHSRKFIEYVLAKQPNAYQALDRKLNSLIGKKSIADKNLVGDIAGSKIIKFMRSRIAQNALIGNLNFWAINLSNFSIAYDEIGNYLNVGVTKFLGSKEWRAFAFENSQMLKGRSIDPDIDISKMHQLKGAISSITNLIEYNNVGSTFVGAYIKAVEQSKYPKEKAIKYADAIARRTQVGYKKFETNNWMDSNSGMLLSQFQNWSFNALNHIVYDLGVGDIPEDIISFFQGEGKSRTRWKALLTLIATSIIVNSLYKSMGLRQPYELSAAIPSIAGISPGRYSDIGPKRILDDLVSLVMSKKDDTKKKAAIRLMSNLLPFGGTQLRRFIEGKVFPEQKKSKKVQKRKQ